MRRTFASALLLACGCVAASVAVGAVDVPYLTGRIVDNANIITPATSERLTAAIKAHQDATTNHVVVLTVLTIQPDGIEDYALNVFEAWKLGQQDKDNGIPVVVVPQDRKMRIEVGYGLEAVLTDGTSGEIIRRVMTPRFKAGDYDGGIEAGVTAIIAHLEGKGEIPVEAESSKSSSSGNVEFQTPDMPWTMKILLGAFIFGIIGLFTAIGVMTPGIGWFLYVFLIPFWAMFPIMIIGPKPTIVLLAAYVIGYPIAKLLLGRTETYKKAAKNLKRKGTASIGGFTFSNFGGSSGSSSSGGGFSGGGGSSGGGGASGSW